jgi:hypothetical protein
MSRVVSFRMDESDPTERQALEVLDRLLSEGFEVRQIMTEALIRAADMTPIKPESADPLVAELRASLLEARQLAGQLSTVIEDVRRGLPPAQQTSGSEQPNELKAELVTAVLRAKKPGLKRG